jgi:hypothetical protein
MSEVDICTENVVIPALSVAIVLKGERLRHLPAYFIPHLAVC